MPTYVFRKLDTGEVFEEFMSYGDRQEKLKDPNIEAVLTTPGIVSGVGGKPDEGFRDVLRQIKKTNIHSDINTF